MCDIARGGVEVLKSVQGAVEACTVETSALEVRSTSEATPHSLQLAAEVRRGLVATPRVSAPATAARASRMRMTAPAATRLRRSRGRLSPRALTRHTHTQWRAVYLKRTMIVNKWRRTSRGGVPTNIVCNMTVRDRRNPATTNRQRGIYSQNSSGCVGLATDSAWLSYSSLQDINERGAFEPLSEEDSTRIEAEVSVQFNDDAVDRKVCLVTDVWVFRSLATCLSIDELPLRAMKMVIGPKSWCTAEIVDYYDCSSIDQRLQGMLLSRRAVEQADNGAFQVWVSNSALKELRQLERRLDAGHDDVECAPPRFAIAECFVAGAFAEVDAATIVEKQSIALAQIRGVVKVVYGGPGNVLQSHLLCWDNRNATIASQIPNVPEKENFHVVLAGPMTSRQELLLAKRHECSGHRVAALQAMLTRINPLYADVRRNNTFYTSNNESSQFSTRLPADECVGELIAEARARQVSVATMSDHESDVVMENIDVETQTVLVDTQPSRVENDRFQTAFENLTGRSSTFVARRATCFLQQNDQYYLERVFPHLFTFGIGGFRAERKHRYSKRAIVTHYLSLATNRFAEDPIFKMAMFDLLSTQRVKSSVFVRVGQHPEVAVNVMKITPEQLRSVMDNRTNRRRAAQTGRPPPPPSENPVVRSVLRSVNSSVSNMWGSNEEREAFSRKLDAMTIMYGQPSVFWTLTPNPDYSITTIFWSGCELPNGRPQDLKDCSIANMPVSSKLSKSIMGNAVVQAEYYRLCCDVFLKALLGWDPMANKPSAKRGIFGHTEAFFCAIEQQGRLIVHHHGVGWIAGLPKTKSDWDKLLASSVLRANFEQYCSSIFAAELPVFRDLNEIPCPSGSCSGDLNPVPISKKFKHLLKAGTPPPDVAVCGVCNRRFTDDEVSSSVVDMKWSQLSPECQAISTEEAVRSIRIRFSGISSDKATADVQLSRLLRKYQVHAYEHARSCVKGRLNSNCRYGFFRELISNTGFGSNDEIKYRRRMGNQWLNTYSEVWSRIFHFNMDSRVLWSGAALQAHRYAIAYTSKQQSVMDNAAVVDLAYRKRLEREREQVQSNTEFQRGIGRLMSLAFATSGVMEIGGPLATTILLDGAAAKFSCKFERLVLLEGLNIMDDEDVEATVIAGRDGIFTQTSIAKYMKRPACLEHYCWFDYCAWFAKSSNSKRPSRRACSFTSEDLDGLDRHVGVHNLRKFSYPHVPEIIGPRLTDYRFLDDPENLEKSELYWRMASLLYCSFRHPKQFLDSEGSAKSHFRAWNPGNQPQIARALEFHQQYYLCLEAAQTFRQKIVHADDEADTSDEDIECSQDAQVNLSGQERLSFVAIYEDLYTASHGSDETVDRECENGNASCASELHAVQTLLTTTLSNADLPEDKTDYLRALNRSVLEKEAREFEKKCRQPQCGLDLNASGDASFSERNSVLVEKLEEAVRHLEFRPCDNVLVVLPQYATIQDVSIRYTLNREQHAAFVLFAAPLLFKIVNKPIPAHLAGVFDTAPLIVTGAGGTGKSRIVDAVRGLVSAWNRPNAVMVVGTTGIAAANLNGQTIHSSIGVGINVSRHLPKHLERPNENMLGVWDPVLGIIADEMSMADLGFIGIWEESLRRLKENDEPFGGMITSLMLDHLQLSTVRGTPLYRISNSRKPFTPPQQRASHLYQSIRKVVCLHQNMRFSDDPEWGEWLQRARVGDWTAEMRRFLTEGNLADVNATRQALVQVISSDNDTRMAINEAAGKIATRTLPPPRRVFIVRARIATKLTPSDSAKLNTLSDNQTGNIPLFLPLYIGMPVRVKANQCIPKGVANGALGKIYHMDWASGTSFSKKSNGVWMASREPVNIYVDVEDAVCPLPFPGLPPAWPTSVMPVCQAKSTFKLQGRSIAIKGYPVVPAFGTTVHGVQGATRDEIAITNLRPAHLQRVDRHALYVALSRLRTRYGLSWIGSRLTEEDFNYFRPQDEVLAENNRLEELARHTMEAIKQYDFALFPETQN